MDGLVSMRCFSRGWSVLVIISATSSSLFALFGAPRKTKRDTVSTS